MTTKTILSREQIALKLIETEDFSSDVASRLCSAGIQVEPGSALRPDLLDTALRLLGLPTEDEPDYFVAAFRAVKDNLRSPQNFVDFAKAAIASQCVVQNEIRLQRFLGEDVVQPRILGVSQADWDEAVAKFDSEDRPELAASSSPV